MSRIIRICIVLSVISICIACHQNNSNHTSAVPVAVASKSKIIDTTKPAKGFMDTGSKTIGATLLAAMRQGAIKNIRFKPAGSLILSDKHDTVIQDMAAVSLFLFNCHNVTIKNCKIGPGQKPGITLSQCTDIHIDSCYLYRVSTGVYAENCRSISVINCQAKDMIGPFPKGQFVQFNNISGGGNKISFNKFENILGQSRPEDAISIYHSFGLATDPIVIESNWIRGGGPSSSGGGIMLGDGGGSNMVAKNNVLVDPGQYGMAVSGGSNMSIVNNTIYAKAQPFTSEGLYYRNYTKLPSLNIVIAKNAVNFTNSKFKVTNTYLGPGNQAPIGWNTNLYVPALNAAILPKSIVYESLLPSVQF